MGMPYTTNPNLPKVRMDAVRLVRQGLSTRAVSRHLGFSQGTIVKWAQRAGELPSNAHVIPTRSSRPHHHPKELPEEIVSAILKVRAETKRCAEVVHHLLGKDGIDVSLSSVKRVLRRHGEVNHSRWKHWHQYPPRPEPAEPGILVEIDTIHDGQSADRLYVYTLLDVCSRWAFAWPAARIAAHRSLAFVERAQQAAPFPFSTLQSDHGAEFSRGFTRRILSLGMAHRHSRVRTPSDNGHLERFNRTLEEECLQHIPRTLHCWRRELPAYLHFYNYERPHMGLDMRTPLETIPSY